MKNYWERINKWLKNEELTSKIILNKGLSTKEIKDFETLVGAKLPKDFADFYKIHNGQLWDSNTTELLQQPEDSNELSEILLSLTDITNEWKIWTDLLDKGTFEYPSKPSSSKIKADWYNSLWIPFTSDGCGNHLCIDLDPAKGGKKGQVIRMIHDSDERTLVANSFTEWIDSFICEKDGGVPQFIRAESPFNAILDEVLQAQKHKYILDLVKSIKKYPNLKRLETLYDLMHLSAVLYVFNEFDLAVKVSKFITNMPITTDIAYNDCIKWILPIQGVIHLENNELGKVEEVREFIWSSFIYSDNETTMKRQLKTFNRILSGQFFDEDYSKKIGFYREKDDKQGEASYRLRLVNKLAYMIVMGGSETFPVDKMRTMMRAKKEFIQNNL